MVNQQLIKGKISQARQHLPSLKIAATEKQKYMQEIQELLEQNNACLVAHYYVDAEIQELAEKTGGFVGDSLAMAKFGLESNCDTLVVAGVRFMGGSAKILSPEKKILMPTLEAECSLDLSCNNGEFERFIAAHPDREVVVYVNTSAEIKALADWTVTSSNALEICSYLHKQGKKILWGPDRFLGDWIAKQTGADMVLYNGSCIVHEEFKAQALDDLILEHPDAAVLVHPESPAEIINRADAIGSTSQLIAASQKLNNSKFIVATDTGVFYKMKQLSPHKEFIPAPTAGRGATCQSCAKCPWMKLNQLKNLKECLINQTNEIFIDKEVRQKALTPLNRMINF
ncbi:MULTISPECIES: quinolinate synthase NadA [Francisella]|uniref:Quinolinate synthase n=1 Tax=Francisella opportunistica TaxID=2016517 RepID=A0A345JRJ8_9GAMM|nr:MULTISPECIES: quinolinate synthase NadA [Francisella]APC91677.1 Quinolinate synthetase [Francisella sp. MA067296]AXH29944.1 quinolinate synthase NadA [Francisella opportunistica]AXH31591.1 quinolinate synthetase [Francisella opportunistica]AXH33239.1 quinolinate synthetase [Francisella opportunistica]